LAASSATSDSNPVVGSDCIAAASDSANGPPGAEEEEFAEAEPGLGCGSMGTRENIANQLL
jgi:hypothetical protein